MLRIALVILAVVLFGFVGACATTGVGSADVKGYSPATSHFWCGEYCVVPAGCEEGLLCVCGKEFRDEDGERQGLSVDMFVFESVFLKIRASATLGLTVQELNRQPYDIRVIHGSPGKKLVCGTFPRFQQFGENPEATGSAVPDDEVSFRPTVKSGEIIDVAVIRTPTSKEEMQRWHGKGHISTIERDFVSHTYSIVEGGNRVEMVCRFRPGCDNYHLPPDAGAEQDEACVDISTCRICEKEQNWSADESAVPWAKECLATGKQTKAITVSSQPATLEEVEEPDF